jgi:hypothetical protein
VEDLLARVDPDNCFKIRVDTVRSDLNSFIKVR